ncbi:hypothetical protein OG698_10190 [Streptomyces sp. NBC_01003]|uniref:hypothetical protein n=1 Tax=Streptomyces sp. NBC_01003 TaxID=2903714 RepID=UPI00386C4A96|nr:hypothetical protein OG698_10190 [Streptomyces sp. NBC_01003]
MVESRHLTEGVRSVVRKWAPPPALCGFLLLLVLVFAVSYAVGGSVGPVAPGMHGTRTSPGDRDGGGAGGMGDMDGMDGMGATEEEGGGR